MKRYKVNQQPYKTVIWDIDDGYQPYPTLEEITDAAVLEFPGTPFDQLKVSSYAGEWIILTMK